MADTEIFVVPPQEQVQQDTPPQTTETPPPEQKPVKSKKKRVYKNPETYAKICENLKKGREARAKKRAQAKGETIQQPVEQQPVEQQPVEQRPVEQTITEQPVKQKRKYTKKTQQPVVNTTQQQPVVNTNDLLLKELQSLREEVKTLKQTKQQPPVVQQQVAKPAPVVQQQQPKPAPVIQAPPKRTFGTIKRGIFG